jgi:hypothetical protein
VASASPWPSSWLVEERTRIEAGLGQVDILVNNAATFESVTWDELDFELWQRVISVTRSPVLARLGAEPARRQMRTKRFLCEAVRSPRFTQRGSQLHESGRSTWRPLSPTRATSARQKPLICGEFSKPSDGREPSTPSLPSSDEAGSEGKAGKPRARKLGKKKETAQGE